MFKRKSNSYKLPPTINNNGESRGKESFKILPEYNEGRVSTLSTTGSLISPALRQQDSSRSTSRIKDIKNENPFIPSIKENKFSLSEARGNSVPREAKEEISCFETLEVGELQIPTVQKQEATVVNPEELAELQITTELKEETIVVEPEDLAELQISTEVEKEITVVDSEVHVPTVQKEATVVNAEALVELPIPTEVTEDITVVDAEKAAEVHDATVETSEELVLEELDTTRENKTSGTPETSTSKEVLKDEHLTTVDDLQSDEALLSEKNHKELLDKESEIIEPSSTFEETENNMGCVPSKIKALEDETCVEEKHPNDDNNAKNEEVEHKSIKVGLDKSDSNDPTGVKSSSIEISEVEEDNTNEVVENIYEVPTVSITLAPDNVEEENSTEISEVAEENNDIEQDDSVQVSVGVTEDNLNKSEKKEVEERVTALEVNNDGLENKKKEGVSAESGLKVERAKDIEIPNYGKDDASQELLMNALKSNEYLFGLDSDELRMSIIDAMFLKYIPNGSYVINEGEQGSEVYVSARGSFDVIVKGKVVNSLGPGKVFGELAVLYHTKRNASILATSNSAVWVLTRKVFRNVMMKDAMLREEQNIQFLRSVPLLRNLEKSSLVKMADLLRSENFQNGVDIVKQGDSGSTFYIIGRGKAVVSIKTDGKSEVVGTLTVGDYFGEYALLNDEARKATVTSVDSTVCLVLDRAPFIELLGSVDILKQSAAVMKAKKPELETQTQSEYAHVSFQDLNVYRTLGVGGFGRVELVSHKEKKKTTWFALKCIKKCVIVQQNQEEHVFNERDIMLACRSPFIARLYRTYRNRKYLFLLMEPCMGGDLWTLLQKRRFFPEATAHFMTGCVVEGLEYLHTRGIVYRDLKPENLMLDQKGYIKLVDFGFAKNIGTDNKTWTFAGTPEYLAPEIVRSRGHDRAADYWSLGILIHELLSGGPPFRGRNQHETYNLILSGIDTVPFSHVFTRRAVGIIKKLCQIQPTARLGYQHNGIDDIKNHRWFTGFDWAALKNTTMVAPIIPNLSGPDDTSQFDKYSKDKDIPPDDNTNWDLNF